MFYQLLISWIKLSRKGFCVFFSHYTLHIEIKTWSIYRFWLSPNVLFNGKLLMYNSHDNIYILTLFSSHFKTNMRKKKTKVFLNINL